MVLQQLAYYINQAPGKHITPSPIHHKLPHWRLKNISLPLPTHGNAEYIFHLFCSRTASRTCFRCHCLGAHLPSVIVSPWRWAAWAIHNTEFPQYRHHGRTHASGFLHFCWDAVDQVQSFCTLFFEHLILQPTGWSLYLTWQYPTSRSRRGDCIMFLFARFFLPRYIGSAPNPDVGHLQRSSEALADWVVVPQYQCKFSADPSGFIR